MWQSRTLSSVALLGVLAGPVANAGDREYYRPGPQVRLGIDIVWGGYGYAPPPPVVVAWYPPPPVVVWYPQAYAPYRYYAPRPVRVDGRGHGPGHHHRHDARRRDD
jgi:hypothetical protein